jgi:sulfite reductase alpha subunit-like flavoprotein
VAAAAAAAAMDGAEAAAVGAAQGADTANGFTRRRPYLATVLENRRMTSPDHYQDVRHVSLDVSGAAGELSYEPGDAVAIWPRADPAAVDWFLERCGLDGNEVVEVAAADADAGAGAGGDATPRTQHRVGDLVAGALDVGGAAPRRFFYEVLSHFVTDETVKDRLEYFASSEGRDDVYRYGARERRTVNEALVDFPGTTAPLEWLLQIVPRLQPRLFSAASAPEAHGGEVHIAAAVVEWTTPCVAFPN